MAYAPLDIDSTMEPTPNAVFTADSDGDSATEPQLITATDPAIASTDSAMSSSESDGDLAPTDMSYATPPYGGIPKADCVRFLDGRDDDGWDARRGSPLDWYMSLNRSWGSLVDEPPVDPLVNLREDFHAVGLTWKGTADRDTSLDSLCNEDWAHVQRKVSFSLLK